MNTQAEQPTSGKKVKRVALVGLNNFNNIGDQIISETTEYLVRQCGIEGIEPYFVDMNPYDSYCREHLKVPFYASNLIAKWKGPLSTLPNGETLGYWVEYTAARVRLFNYFQACLKDADAILFSGGAFIKYKTQGLNFLVDLITEIADDRNIPVMMSAMGVEGYSEENINCQKLKAAINRSCVKRITVRDDFALLRDKYMTNTDIVIRPVGDPAFWIPECYQITREPQEMVGLGVIRSDNFRRYGVDFSESDVMRLYQDIIHNLEQSGIEWRLFSNGLTSDYRFGVELLESLGYAPEEKFVPRPQSSAELLHTLKQFKAVIAARLHACISAYALDIPTIGLVWNDKLTQFGRMFIKEDFFPPVNQLTGEIVVAKLKEAMEFTYDRNKRQEWREATRAELHSFLQSI
ncbi:polysaccharide pyruvyl transferase family protein [Brevibacillus sp. TJ4]|uniref:polysaccharide pyruvyl transferase family protein n=1 Tax=Brevibacillus sp. TJ4 TaxID=3234853 RepID=UPI0037CEF891